MKHQDGGGEPSHLKRGQTLKAPHDANTKGSRQISMPDNKKGSARNSVDDDDFAAVDIINAVDKYDVKTGTNEGFKERIANATHVKGKRN